MRAARDALYVVRRDGATHSLWRLKHGADAKPERIALPFEGAIELTGASDRLDGVVFDLGGWTRATKPWFYDPSVGRVAQLPFVAPGAYDAPDDIMALPDGRVLDGAANLGIRPSFNPPKELLEPHFFDFSEDLYGQTIEVEFHAFLRPEGKYDSLDALVAQIAKDCEDAKAALAG